MRFAPLSPTLPSPRRGRLPSGPSRRAQPTGTSTPPPSSSALALPPWGWPALGPASAPSSAASSSAMPGWGGGTHRGGGNGGVRGQLHPCSPTSPLPPGTPRLNSSFSPTPSWALPSLRPWGSSASWWPSSSSSPCDRTGDSDGDGASTLLCPVPCPALNAGAEESPDPATGRRGIKTV